MEAAVEFGLSRDGAGIMLDPGMGKTSISLAIIAVLLEAKAIRRVLVVAPLNTAKATWPAEVRKWTDFSHLKIATACEQDEAGRKRVCLDISIQIVTVNPESLQKVLEASWFSQTQFDLLILDESTKFKDSTTKRFKALKKQLHTFSRRLILTGTPVPNGLADLFGQMYVVDFGQSLGKFITHFRNEFTYQKPGDPWSYYLKPGAEETIYARVKDRLMRLRAKDHLKLPEFIHVVRPVEFPPALWPEYKRLERDYIARIQDVTVVGVTPAAAGNKLRQLANGFVYTEDEAGVRQTTYVHSKKLDSLLELVDEMQGRPLLVGYEYRADASRILDNVPGAVDFGADPKRLDYNIARFNAGDLPVAIGHPASIGHGLNLQEACHEICWYSDTWNLEYYIQFMDRVRRQGNPFPYVTVHHISATGTRDEKVAAVLADKDLTQESFNSAILTPL